ncbi:MAG: hypothetical protein HXX19_11825 [Rhodoferax sp.]|nr:hypothetical protein [Rhodoferax sp.]
MNGKRAKALNRIRAGVVRLEDIARLKRTEVHQGAEPKPLQERRKKANGLTPQSAASRAALAAMDQALSFMEQINRDFNAAAEGVKP